MCGEQMNILLALGCKLVRAVHKTASAILDFGMLIAEHQKHPSSPWMFPSPKTGEMYHPDAGDVKKATKNTERRRGYDKYPLRRSLNLRRVGHGVGQTFLAPEKPNK